MGILDIHTGELQTPTATGILTRESIPLAPSVADKNSAVSGYKYEKFSLLDSGIVCEFLVDVVVADTVANLKAAGKIKYIGSFAGNLD